MPFHRNCSNFDISHEAPERPNYSRLHSQEFGKSGWNSQFTSYRTLFRLKVEVQVRLVAVDLYLNDLLWRIQRIIFRLGL
jgi:hypothetical protein